MDTNEYRLVFLPTFEKDMNQTVDYIAGTLNNPEAADRLLDDVLHAINERLKCPKAFEPWKSERERELDYYRIYVRHYTVFYVVYNDIMEVRRFLYTPSNWKRKL